MGLVVNKVDLTIKTAGFESIGKKWDSTKMKKMRINDKPPQIVI